MRIADLFSGAGGLSFGVCRGMSDLGIQPIIELAADLDQEALEIYDTNLAPRETHVGDVSALVDFGIKGGKRATFSRDPWIRDRRLAARLAGTDVLIGGPPCQGHSNLNNHTRRSDVRNELYLTMPAMAIALQVPIVIIENVREVKVDHQRVVAKTIDLLTEAGYSVAQGVLSAVRLGLPQTRHRFFIVAVRSRIQAQDVIELDSLVRLERKKTNLGWAIRDLSSRPMGGLHRAAVLSDENKKRIAWLFENGEYDLPDDHRPDCHKNGHTYGSVYGRLRWGKPSGTITSGFLTPGRGRYIHPSKRRALTPHEAARIQGFPDSFEFRYKSGEIPANKTLTKVIGDAVPPAMGQAAFYAALELQSRLESIGLNEAA
jgi:DNA (cytosine-5)-methyltransferase 1